MSDAHAQSSTGSWQPFYWALAAVPGGVAYAFDAAQLYFFEATRGPNLGLPAQLGLLLLFYGGYTAVPWLVWILSQRHQGTPLPEQVGRLALLGGVLSVVHLAVLSLFLRLMHSPPGWGPAELGHSLLEVWLGNAGLWLLVFAGTCAVVLVVQGRTVRTDIPGRIEVAHGNRKVSLRPSEIAWVETSGNYVELHTHRGSFLLRQSLTAMERQLGAAGFVRVHRQALVNLSHVESIQGEPGGGHLIELRGGLTAPLSRRRFAKFRKQLSETPDPLTDPSIPQH